MSGPDVRANQDPYDDVHVVEVPFHGGPRRVLQGLTSQPAGPLNLLLLAIVRNAGASLPAEYRRQVEVYAGVVLALSEGMCEQVGLWRGTFPPERRSEEVSVPGQVALDVLCDALCLPLAVLDGWPEEGRAVLAILARLLPRRLRTERTVSPARSHQVVLR